MDKKIHHNFLYNSSYQILLTVLPLITAPYLSRVLGSEGIGEYAYQYNIANCFILLGMLGINNYGNRTIAAIRDNYFERSRIFWEIWGIQCICSMISTIIYIVLSFLLHTDKMLILIFSLLVISTAFDINWFFSGLEQFKLTATRSMIIKLVSVGCVFIFVRGSEDLIKYSWIIVLGMICSNLILWVFLPNYIKFSKISIDNMLKRLPQILLLFLPLLAITLYNKMDTIMLGYMTNMKEVGFYENASKIVNIPTGIITSLGTVMLPRISYLIAGNDTEQVKNHIEKSLNFSLVMSFLFTGMIIGVSPQFIPWFFGKGFSPAIILTMVLAPKIIFLAIANVVRTQYLIPSHQDSKYIISFWGGAIINLIMNIILIPQLGALGAVIGTLCAEFVVMLYQLLAIKSEIRLSSILVKSCFLSLNIIVVIWIIYNGMLWLRYQDISIIVSLILISIIGIVLYFVNIWIFRKGIENG